MANKYVYRFSEGNKDMKELLGGKGANLAEMTSIGLPVPPGFTITTEVCNYYSAAQRTIPRAWTDQVGDALASLESDTGKKFGDADDPLLLSVRSGARASMPGMMDTILNLGLNDETVEGVIADTGNERFAYDCYRRFVSMYADVVLGCKPEDDDEPDPFEELLDKMKRARASSSTPTSPPTTSRISSAQFKKAPSRSAPARTFPDDPMAAALGRHHRRLRLAGTTTAPSPTAASTTSRTRGARRSTCRPWSTATPARIRAPGVGFTRNPASGENVFYGEFLVNAQGEDVVAGVRTPRPVIELKDVWPDVYDQLMDVQQTLERELRDMQDFEFTIEHGRLFMLQTRNGKRTGLAAIRIAVDMADEGLIITGRGAHAHRAGAAQPAPAADLRPAGQGAAPSRKAASWPRACPPAPAPPPAASCSTPPTPSPGPAAASRCCSSATSRARTTSAAWTPPRASSPPRAA